MKKPNFKHLTATLLVSVLVVACGGRSDALPGAGAGASPGPASTPTADVAPGDISTSVTALLNYVRGLFGSDENGDPVDINATALAVDDSVEPEVVSF